MHANTKCPSGLDSNCSLCTLVTFVISAQRVALRAYEVSSSPADHPSSWFTANAMNCRDLCVCRVVAQKQVTQWFLAFAFRVESPESVTLLHQTFCPIEKNKCFAEMKSALETDSPRRHGTNFPESWEDSPLKRL